MNYVLAQERVESATNLRNYAGMKLEHMQVQRRAQEIISQHDPIALLKGINDMTERDRIIAIVRYVVYGRKDWEG